MDFRQTTTAELSAKVRAQEISATEVVTAALENIERTNKVINAFCAADADLALKDAAALDRRIAAGEDVGPLAGMPLGVKDTEDAAGYVTTIGSTTRANLPKAVEDSALVARLKAAGCIVVGKTNMPEFGVKATTDNPLFGATLNPWDLTKSPGGSSGGSSAALSAGLVPLATSSDGGGSTRVPASLTALPGFKPTTGAIPSAERSAPGWPLISSKGVYGATVADSAQALDVARGPHLQDHFRTIPLFGESWIAAIDQLPAKQRFAWCPTMGYSTVDTEIEEVTYALVTKLRDAGHVVEEISSVLSKNPLPPGGVLIGSFISRTIAPFRGTPQWKDIDANVALIAEFARLTMTAEDVVGAIDDCHRMNAEALDSIQGFDFLLTPTVNGHTPLAEMKVPGQIFVDMLTARPDLLGPMTPGQADELAEVMKSYESINMPVGIVNGVPSMEWAALTAPGNLMGWPAGSVHAGLAPSTGMPVGLQVWGRKFTDRSVLQAMHLLEQLRGPITWPTL